MVPLHFHLAPFRRQIIVLGGVLLVSWNGWARAGENAKPTQNDQFLNRWFEAQSGLRTWQANFRQIRSMQAIKQPLVSTGRVVYAAPGSFRWEVGSPARTIAISNGREMLVCYPLMKRAERYPLDSGQSGIMGEALSLLDVGFPRDRRTFDKQFRVRRLEASQDRWRLVLQPANTKLRQLMPEIQVELAEKDFQLLANEIRLPDGSSLRNEFVDARTNEPVAASEFDLQVPEDFQVTQPLKK